MKVRIFYSADSEGLENLVNDFIADKKVIDIKFTTDPPSNGYDAFFNALIIYEETETGAKQ